MPQALDHPAIREQVRLLYIANGRNLTQAAKTAGIPVDRAEKWKERGLWDQGVDLATKQISVSESVGLIASRLESELLAQGKQTKSHLSSTTLKAAARFEEMPSDKVIEKSGRLLDITKVASSIHGWTEATASSALNLNVLSGGRAIVQVKANDSNSSSSSPTTDT